MLKRILAVLLTMVLLMSVIPTASAAQLNGFNLQVRVDDRAPVCVKVYRSSYNYHYLVSLRDLASALLGTPKGFDIWVEDDPEFTRRIFIETDGAYEPLGMENHPNEDLRAIDYFYASTAYNKLHLDGQEMRLYTYVRMMEEDIPDVYMEMTDLGMYMDLVIEYEDSSTLRIDTSADYIYDLQRQEEDGYFHYLHGVVLADVNTGCLLYQNNGAEVTQIASLTKLMTYLLVKEALDTGRIREDDIYAVSEDVYRLSNAEDGTYRKGSTYGSLELGEEVTVRELLNALLITSANETALALAEIVSGSEEAFVQQMNTRAAQLGLTTAAFYNSNGIPLFTQSATASKYQNEMSAMDMMRLTAYLLQNYREHLTAITSRTRVELPGFGLTDDQKVSYCRNTNALLYNIPDCLGLKTGTTTRSGANIVAALPVTDSLGQTHDVVVVLLGCEDNGERFEKSAWLLKYAQQYYAEHPFPENSPVTVPETIPETQMPIDEITVPETIPPIPAQKVPEVQTQTLPLAPMVLAFLAGAVLMLLLTLIANSISARRRRRRTSSRR